MEMLTNGHFLPVVGVALDKQGNLFVSCNARGSGSGDVVEFPKGCRPERTCTSPSVRPAVSDSTARGTCS